jgi:deazaflavin-dependent oxidoreductase (nitroreductase family)
MVPAVARGHAPFALLNRSGNLAVRAALRSPLHPLVSGRLALITVTGRRSGREYTFPVGYSQEGDRVTIVVGWPERKVWWRNLRGEGAPVRIRIKGEERTGHARAGGAEDSGVVVDVRLD